ncbi:hypothetical protein [Pseudoxanthomonas sp. UC19_8]|uniref:hypothetical protein n=1 Tax=Pseudoxanthomonas sp. UC19_8 TaxID=3350175 RepID=UPI0036D300CF
MRNADLILVMKDGEIVEQGRFDALVAQGGLFAQLEAGGQFVADAEEEVVAVAE